MKIRFLAALAALALAGSAVAQQEPSRPQFGLGIAVIPLTTGPIGALSPTVEVYVPFQVAPNFRIEPSLGIYTNDDGTVSQSDLTLGVGAFVQKRVAAAVDLYAGGRIKLNFASVDTGVTDDSDTDFLLAGAVGGEYYIAPKFTVGLEAELGLYQDGDVNGGDDGFFTTGLAFLRVFF